MTNPTDEAVVENLRLALANDPRIATPEQASEAYLALTAMRDHRGDGIPTQYVHGRPVADAARILWIAFITAQRELAAERQPAERTEKLLEGLEHRVVALVVERAEQACRYVAKHNGDRQEDGLYKSGFEIGCEVCEKAISGHVSKHIGDDIARLRTEGAEG